MNLRNLSCFVDAVDSKPPLITIVIAVFNAKHTLEQCLSSVIRQSSSDYELVVIDGGSTDGSVETLQTHAKHFAYWTSEPDRGVYDAWNKALQHAKGDWICFLGADDYLFNDEVLYQLKRLLEALPSQASVAYGKIALLNRDGAPMFELGEPWELIADQFKRRMCLPHPAVLHRRNLFDIYGGFDPTFRIAGDYEFLLRVLQRQRPYFLGQLVVTAMRPGGLSSDPTGTIRGLDEVYKAQKKNGIEVLSLFRWMDKARAHLRLIFVKFLGRRMASLILDFGRICVGLPAYWTKV